MYKFCSIAPLILLFSIFSNGQSHSQTWQLIETNGLTSFDQITYDSTRDMIVIIAFAGPLSLQDGRIIFINVDDLSAELNDYPIKGPSAESNVHDLLVTPNGDVYTATDQGVLKTTNNGNNWILLNNGLGDDSLGSRVVDAIAFNPTLGLLAASDRRIYYYDNNESRFKIAYPSLNLGFYNSIVAYNNFIAMHALDKYVISEDDGNSWKTRLYKSPYPSVEMNYDPAYSYLSYIAYGDNSFFIYDIANNIENSIHFNEIGIFATGSAQSEHHVFIAANYFDFTDSIYIYDVDLVALTYQKLDVSSLATDSSYIGPITIDIENRLYVPTNNGLYRTTAPVVSSAPPVAVPSAFSLSPACPNPVSSGNAAIIEYSLPSAANITLALYNALGQELRRIEKRMEPGAHTERISTAGLSPGVYYFTLIAGAKRNTRMLVVR